MVVASEEPVWYTGDTSDFPPQVEDAMQEYIDESHSKTVAVLPLKRPRLVDEEEDDPDKRPDPEPPIGALIVERIEDVRVPPKMVQRVEVVCEHSAIALANSLEHSNLFLMPLWRTLGKASWVVKGRTLPKTVAIVVAVFLLLAAMVILPWGFKMQADGTLQPVDQREVFAEIDGVVGEVFVKHGDAVEEGRLLVQLENTDLEILIERNLGDLAATNERIDSIRAGLSQPNRRRSEREETRLRGEWQEEEAKRTSLLEQQALYEAQKKQLEVRAPMSGEVVTWNVDELLMRRPVKRGDALMRLADPEGEWELEVLMPDKRMGHIIQAQKGYEADPHQDLEAEFILATDPDTTHVGKVKEIGEGAEVRGDEGNIVPIKVEITPEVRQRLPKPLRPGATVRAKVKCGRRPIGYVLFHDLIAFIQSKILFRWF